MIGKSIALFLPDFRPGGAERVCVNLANAFASRGLAVDAVVMRNEGELRALLDPRVRVRDLGAPRPRYVFFPLVRYLRSAKPDALLANMWPLTILAVLARKYSKVRCKLVVVEHTTWSVSRLARRWRTRLMIKSTMRYLLPKADAVVAVSKGAALDLAQFAGLKSGIVRTIYNPVVHGKGSGQAVIPERCSAWAAGPHKRVLAVGTLKAVKDLPTLLQAFSLLCGQMDARLLILGDGNERARLELLVRELGLQEVVEMPGFELDTSPFYAHADLFVLSSVNEGLSTVIIEALERGVPVVSTDCPSGPREILDNGRYGKLVPVGDVKALAASMQASLLSTHDHATLIKRSEDFHVDTAVEQYLDILLPDWRESGGGV